MKRLKHTLRVAAAIFGIFGSVSIAQAQGMACWYGPSGNSTGADWCRGDLSPPCEANGSSCTIGSTGVCRSSASDDYSYYMIIDRKSSAGCEQRYSQGPSGGMEDEFVYTPGKAVVHLDQRGDAGIDGYVTFKKSLVIDKYGTEIKFMVEVSTSENYYTIVMITPGQASLKSGGTGYRSGIFGYSDDWNMHAETQAIYANGFGLQAAVQDLSTKFNGTDGRLNFSASGDALGGTMVLTISMP